MYEQIWDGKKERMCKEFDLACCSCGLVHRVQVEVKKNGHIYMTFERREKDTKKIRQKHGIRVSKKRGSKW